MILWYWTYEKLFKSQKLSFYFVSMVISIKKNFFAFNQNSFKNSELIFLKTKIHLNFVHNPLKFAYLCSNCIAILSIEVPVSKYHISIAILERCLLKSLQYCEVNAWNNFIKHIWQANCQFIFKLLLSYYVEAELVSAKQSFCKLGMRAMTYLRPWSSMPKIDFLDKTF